MIAREVVTRMPSLDSPLGSLLNEQRAYLLAIASAELPACLTPKAGVSDLVQLALTSAWANRDRFRGHTLEELRRWLRSILLHKLSDLRRRFATAARDASKEVLAGVTEWRSDLVPAPDEIVARAETVRELTGLLDRLPNDDRAAVLWRVEGELSFAQIGERLGRSEEAARKLFTRALARLRAYASNYQV